jgi:hypothetical protein
MGDLSRVPATIGQFARRPASLRCTTCGLACGNDEEDVGQNSSSRTYGRVSRSSAEPRLQWLGDMCIPWEKQVGCDMLSQPMAAGSYSPACSNFVITFLSSSACLRSSGCLLFLFLCSSTSIASLRAVQARGRLGRRNLVKIWAGIINVAGRCVPHCPPQGSNPSL